MLGVSFNFQLGSASPLEAAVALALILLGFLASPAGVWVSGLPGMLLVLATRTSSVVFAHPIRLRIIARLSLLPGDHFRSIVRALGIGMGDTAHHLRVLVDNGYVRAERANGKVRYYLVGADEDVERSRLFSRYWTYRDIRLRILFVLRNRGAVTPAFVASQLGISRQLARYHLGQLVELGLARKNEGRYYA